MKKTIEIPEGYEARIDGNKVILEPKESEDEKMIRIIEDAICTNEAQQLVRTKYGLELTNLADWLEKKCKEDTDISSFPKEQQAFMRKYVSLDKITLIKLLAERDANNAEIIESFEKQSEQKSADKVEPKFKVGDWVVFNNKHQSIYQVEKIEDGYYILRHTHGGTFRVCVLHDESLRFWTIQDAKDGDVLAEHETIVLFKKIEGLNIKCYCTYHYLGYNPTFYVDTLQNKTPYRPATKEQRDLLFQKMHEAGYIFDFNKKELKKAEQKPNFCHHEVDFSGCSEEYRKAYYDGWNNCNQQHKQLEAEQKPSTWNKEDENEFNDILTCGEHHCYLDAGNIEWLKSLKNKLIWKPSDEQMKELGNACAGLIFFQDVLESLYNDLKKLKG